MRMTIPESMSYQQDADAAISIQELTMNSRVQYAPQTIKDAMRVVRYEANLRLKPEYV